MAPGAGAVRVRPTRLRTPPARNWYQYGRSGFSPATSTCTECASAGTAIAVVDLGVASVAALDADDDLAFVAVATFGAPVALQRLGVGGALEHWCPTPVDSALLPNLVVRQVHYPSNDGTLVPMFVAHRDDVEPSLSTPLVLTGYGGFNVSLTPNFVPDRYLWLEHGGVFAVANLRGGAEFAAVAAGEGDHRHILLVGRVHRPQHVRRAAAGADGQQHITLTTDRFHIT